MSPQTLRSGSAAADDASMKPGLTTEARPPKKPVHDGRSITIRGHLALT
ncbi:hypothetical protein QNA24_33550 [Rhodococcus qingshengii]|nr:hypothetical protein [Rhodococcus qingshengii]MDJ0491314.1 hypothetical protein [Rhodococcus qingshengii]